MQNKHQMNDSVDINIFEWISITTRRVYFFFSENHFFFYNFIWGFFFTTFIPKNETNTIIFFFLRSYWVNVLVCLKHNYEQHTDNSADSSDFCTKPGHLVFPVEKKSMLFCSFFNLIFLLILSFLNWSTSN